MTREKYAASGSDAYSGIGGLSAEGRWHSRGRLVVYAARSEALARLEALVHFSASLAPRLVLVEATLPAAVVTSFSGALPKGWDDVPDSGSARVVGDDWLRTGSSVAIEVPSIHSTSEANVLINPAHADFRRFVCGAPMPIAFDQRLNDPKLR